jgi:hypothetical protein
MPSLTQFIVWIIVGLIGVSLTGFLITWERGDLVSCEIWAWVTAHERAHVAESVRQDPCG